ncbi:MAG: hypothetical protein EOM21_14275 [Gammaproteobacteria bacterium]|nr:hypothetical protein [Gammaproteobacteria bacterium]
MSIQPELERAKAESLRYRALCDALNQIDAGQITLANAIRRLRTQYSRAFREHEAPYLEAKREADRRHHKCD